MISTVHESITSPDNNLWIAPYLNVVLNYLSMAHKASECPLQTATMRTSKSQTKQPPYGNTHTHTKYANIHKTQLPNFSKSLPKHGMVHCSNMMKAPPPITVKASMNCKLRTTTAHTPKTHNLWFIHDKSNRETN